MHSPPKYVEHSQLNMDMAGSHPIKTSSSPNDELTTPKEELLESEDYNSVFKSRPKVALSPAFTPIAQPGLGSRQSMTNLSRLSPEYMSLNSAASTSESEDGGERDPTTPVLGRFGFGSPSVGPSSRFVGGSRIPGIGRKK